MIVLTPQAPGEPSGSWDSIHVFEAAERGRQAHYKLTSTIMLHMVDRSISTRSSKDEVVKSKVGLPTGARSSESHKRTLLSGDPDAIRVPSGEKLRHLTRSSCAFQISTTLLPVNTSQVEMVPSSYPAKILVPSGHHAPQIATWA